MEPVTTEGSVAAQPSAEVLAKADKMDDDKDFEPLYTFLLELERAYPGDFDVMWRLARANYDMSNEKPPQRKEFLLQSYAYAQKLLANWPDHYLSHKWYAIVLSALSDFRSTKEKIQESVLIREHCLKAIQLHGKGGDQTLNHLYGRWCFAVASISWMERKLASALFATPPESSYQEALQYFLNAENISDSRDEFLENLLWTAHTYHKLGDVAKAKGYYGRAAQVQPKSASDIELVKEAQQKSARL